MGLVGRQMMTMSEQPDQPEATGKSTVHNNTSEAIRDTQQPWPPPAEPMGASTSPEGEQLQVKAPAAEDIEPYNDPEAPTVEAPATMEAQEPTVVAE
jgi:hypothetical protein